MYPAVERAKPLPLPFVRRRLRPKLHRRVLFLWHSRVLDDEIVDAVRARIAEHGLAVRSVGVKDVILPGEMKEILNQVVQVEKVAQANLIKRR